MLRTHRQAIGHCSYTFWKGNCLEFVEKGAFCRVAPTRVWGGSCLELNSALLQCCTGDLGTKTLTRYNLSTRYQVGFVLQRDTLSFGGNVPFLESKLSIVFAVLIAPAIWGRMYSGLEKECVVTVLWFCARFFGDKAFVELR